MSLKEKVKANASLKKMVIRAMTPRNQPRPRCWVKYLVNPFVHSKARGARICRNTRMDVLPWNNFVLGKDSIIEDFATINNGVGDVIIGERTRIGIGNTVIGPVKIGNDIMFAQNVVLSGLNHSYEDVSQPIHLQDVSTAPIVVEDESWIAANSVIVAGVRIGKHSVVAAGSVVTRDVPPYSIVAGNPAKVIKRYNADTKSWEKV